MTESRLLFSQALAGTLANVLSITLVFPFDTARTRLQTQDRRKSEISIFVIKDLLKEEGWSGLYKGWRSLVLSLAITNFVYFYTFNGLKSSASTQHLQQDFIFGLIAGCLAVLVSNPFWVVNTRLKLRGVNIGTGGEAPKGGASYEGISDCFKKIFINEGIGPFFAGFKSSLVLASNPAINFMTYEFLRRFLSAESESFLSSSLLYFTFGGLAKFIATMVTYPLQVIQTRSRAGLPIVSVVLKGSSWLSRLTFLYRGFESKLTQTVLTSAIMFLTYEHLRAILFNFVNVICLLWTF